MVLDDIRFAFKQLKVNLARTIYNVILSIILGVISLFILSINISVRVNGDVLAKERYYIEDDITIGAETCVRSPNGVTYMDSSESEVIINYYKEHSEYIDQYYFMTSSGKDNIHINVVDIQYLKEKGKIRLNNNIEPTKDKFVYISKDYAISNNLKENDLLHNEYVIDKKRCSVDYVIADIFDYHDGNSILYDVNIFNSNIEVFNDISIMNVSAVINKNHPVEDTISFNEDMINFYSKLNNGNSVVTCERYNEYSRVKMMTNIFFYASLIFIIIISLLTLSIISHSSVIMIDLNKNTFGVYKALGMKDKDTFIIVLFEVIVSFIIGLLISVIIFYLCKYPIETYLSVLFKSLYKFIDINYLNDFNLILYNGWYIPFIFIIILVGILLLFSYKEVRKIVFANPIKLIVKND